MERIDGELLLVMAYMPGGSLEKLLAKHPDGLPIERAIEIARDLLQALAAFHDLLGLPVHRDLKPSNILFDGEGCPHLADFGLAQLAGVSGRSQLAATSHPGTPLYAAPEQLASPEPLTPSADVYTLGCVFFEMLSGQPFRRLRPGTMASTLRPEVPSWPDQALAKALAEEPWDRYQSACEMADDLASASAQPLQPDSNTAPPAEVAAATVIPHPSQTRPGGVGCPG